MENIITPDEFNINNITYGAVKPNEKGGKTIYILHNKKPVIMQLPTMFTAPYGLSEWINRDKKTNEVTSISYSLDLSFKGKEERPNLQGFFEMIEKLDKKIINDGYENCVQWLGVKKSKDQDVVEALYTSKLKFSKDKETKERNNKYPPAFSLKLLKNNDGDFQCEVFNEKKQKIELTEENSKNARVTSLLTLGGIWIVGNKFGLTWNVKQLRLQSSSKITGYAFKSVVNDDIGDQSSDDDNDESLAHLNINDNQTINKMRESSDDDLEQ